MFVLTNGKSFVKRNPSNSKYTATNKKEEATEFTQKQARDLLKNRKPQFNWLRVDNYKMMNLNTDETTSRNNIPMSKEGIYIGENSFEFDESILEDIEQEVRNITNCEGWSISQLNIKLDTLTQAQSYYDSAMSDVLHLIEINNPPAHIRTKIYKIVQDLREKHTLIKQEILYINVMKRSVNESWSFDRLKRELENTEYKGYKGRTDYFSLVLDMM